MERKQASGSVDPNDPAGETANPILSPDNPHSQETQAISDQSVQNDIRCIDDRVKRAEWLMIGLTAAIALFALCAVVVGVLQWSAMNGQLAEMKNGGVDAQNAMRLDQRAWLGVAKVNSFGIRAGPNFSIPFDMINTGKTPALNVTIRTSLKSLEKGKKFVPTYPDPIPIKPSIGVVQPQMHMELSTLPIDISITQYGDIENGRGILYAYGDILYDDIFGRPHETTFCVMYWAGLPSPAHCDTYNGAT